MCSFALLNEPNGLKCDLVWSDDVDDGRDNQEKQVLEIFFVPHTVTVSVVNFRIENYVYLLMNQSK